MAMETTHIYSFKNDGEPRMHSPLENAISEALHKRMFDQNEYEWTAITVEKLPCNETVRHYPNLCYHYEVTIV